jgi:hypothetical protein
MRQSHLGLGLSLDAQRLSVSDSQITSSLRPLLERVNCLSPRQYNVVGTVQCREDASGAGLEMTVELHLVKPGPQSSAAHR